MVPFDGQMPTVIRPTQNTPDVTYEPPLRVGFGINDQTVGGAKATMGRTILVPGAGPNATHYHAANDVCWYILYDRVQAWFARSSSNSRSIARKRLINSGNCCMAMNCRFICLSGCAGIPSTLP